MPLHLLPRTKVEYRKARNVDRNLKRSRSEVPFLRFKFLARTFTRCWLFIGQDFCSNWRSPWSPMPFTPSVKHISKYHGDVGKCVFVMLLGTFTPIVTAFAADDACFDISAEHADSFSLTHSGHTEHAAICFAALNWKRAVAGRLCVLIKETWQICISSIHRVALLITSVSRVHSASVAPTCVAWISGWKLKSRNARQQVFNGNHFSFKWLQGLESHAHNFTVGGGIKWHQTGQHAKHLQSQACCGGGLVLEWVWLQLYLIHWLWEESLLFSYKYEGQVKCVLRDI